MEATQVKFNTNEIIMRLAKLQADMDFVREHIDDMTLAEDDIASLKEAEKEYRAGKTISLQSLKKELNL